LAERIAFSSSVVYRSASAGGFLMSQTKTPEDVLGGFFVSYTSHSFTCFGSPIMYNSASGAPILANRSIKSQTGSPAIGRMRAVTNVQNTAQRRTRRTG